MENLKKLLWQEDRRQAGWDDWCRQRPRCGDCGRPILEDRALIVDEEMICDKCVSRRKVWISD